MACFSEVILEDHMARFLPQDAMLYYIYRTPTYNPERDKE